MLFEFYLPPISKAHELLPSYPRGQSPSPSVERSHRHPLFITVLHPQASPSPRTITMDVTLSQLPFSSEDRVDGRTLPPKPSSVCQVCWGGVFAQYFGLPCPVPNREGEFYRPSGRYYSYSTSFAEMESRAVAGCVWCQFLVAAQSKGAESAMGVEDSVHITVKGNARKDDRKVVQAIEVTIRGLRRTLLGFVCAGSDDPAAPHIVIRTPILEVKSARVLALATKCIEECAHGHERCIALSASLDPPLPTRVIDCSDPLRPRLLSTGGQRGKYLALSYVWGGDQVHKTTTTNISAYERGIDPFLFPATITDAIYVTHALGFMWLWVDSLCIIQDSDEDKRREIGNMHHIYRYAYLTVIAASAEKVSDGFLQDRSPAQQLDLDDPSSGGDIIVPFICPPCHLTRPAEDRVGTVHIIPQQLYGKWLYDSGKYSRDVGLIGTRAWCLQEYLISPRSLVFTARTLQFRCLTATRNVDGSLCDTLTELRIPYVLFLPESFAVARDTKEWDEVHQAWLDIIMDYSGRSMTVPSDKLVACAAVAGQFHRVLRSEYLAGLWHTTLLSDLLWSVSHAQWRKHMHPPAVYRAPSWSWAAVEGAVYWGFLGGDALATVVRCEVSLKDAALPFGQVTGATLVLRGTLLPCLFGAIIDFVEARPRHTFLLRSFKKAQRSSHDCNLDASGEADDVEVEPNLSGIVEIDYPAVVEIHRIWALPLVMDVCTVRGIIVALADSSVQSKPLGQEQRTSGTYKRVGQFEFTHAEWNPDNGDPIVSVSLEAAHALGRALKDGGFPTKDIELV